MIGQNLRLLEMQTKRMTHFRYSADSASACKLTVFITLPYAFSKYIRYEAAYASVRMYNARITSITSCNFRQIFERPLIE